jgi:hypothetical protein
LIESSGGAQALLLFPENGFATNEILKLAAIGKKLEIEK